MLYDDAFLAVLERGLREALPLWGQAPDTPCRLLTVSENATFLVEPPGRRIVMRVQRPGYNSEAQIRSELAWLAALRDDDVVPTPAPIPLADGAPLAGFDAGGTRMLIACFEFMPGLPPDETGDLVAWFATLGEMTARLHDHARRWTPPAGFVRRVWDWQSCIGPDADWGDWRCGIGLGPEGRAVLERAVAHLRELTNAYGRDPARWGLIHADMKPANLLAEGSRLGVIDFDDCGMGWFMFDFAASVSGLECDPRLGALQASWLEGYRRAAPVAPEDEAILPALVLLRRIQLTAWAAGHSETPLGQSAGAGFTAGTVDLAERYLSEHG
jgi:Ser/Thr protein kinase RdoA (MazF antagonist)